MSTLLSLGGIIFEVAPINLHEIETTVGADYAEKDVVGAAKPREYMGEADTTITLSGKMFPQKFGGLGGFAALQLMAQLGVPQMVVQGSGAVWGFYLIDKVTRTDTYLDAGGVGRIVEFEINLIRSPQGPTMSGMISQISRLF